jgi:hypothetical protein
VSRGVDVESLFESWREIRPPVHRIFKVKVERILRQKSVNRSFLNGDFFRGMADVDVSDRNGALVFSGLGNLGSAKIIFCESSVLQELLNQHKAQLNCSVIIAGNSDHDFENFPRDYPSSLKHLFLQNSFLANSDLVTGIPIGIENARYAVNGNSRFMRNALHWSSKKPRLLVGPFGLTHKERLSAVRALATSNEFDFVPGRLSPRKYSVLASSYRYIACPRGNGVDTHRFWETLYRGSLPVVIEDSWSLNMHSLGVPMIRTPSWNPIDVSLALQNCMLEEFDPRKIPALWPEFWEERILGKAK